MTKVKLKTVKKILRGSFAAYVKSIKNERIAKLVHRHGYITGGAIVSLLLGEEVNDLDVYFDDIDAAVEIVNYYAEAFKRADTVEYLGDAHVRSDGEGVEVFVDYDTGFIRNKNVKEKYAPVLLTSNAISLTNNVQLITRFVGTPEKVHKNYDFVHCTNVYIPYTDELRLNQRAIESILTKELRYMGSKYPICSVIRSRKYIKRGWTINAGQYLKMAFQISDLDLNNIDVLRDQLVGVDATYFNEFINRLNALKKDGEDIDERRTSVQRESNETSGSRVDGTTLSWMIDEIFDEMEHDEEDPDDS